MTRYNRVAICSLALSFFFTISVRDTNAVIRTLNLVPAESHITINGTFSGLPTRRRKELVARPTSSPAQRPPEPRFKAQLPLT